MKVSLHEIDLFKLYKTKILIDSGHEKDLFRTWSMFTTKILVWILG